MKERENIIVLEKLLSSPTIDLQQLHTISRQKDGFINNNIRKRVWPKLLGLNRYSNNDYRQNIDQIRDFFSIECDILRSLWNYDNIVEWDETQRNKRRVILYNIIKAILSRHPNKLHYYQGYHDVISVFLLILDEDHLTYNICETVTLTYFADSMSESFENLKKAMGIVTVILQLADAELYHHLNNANIQPYYCISWVLTWFAHDLR